MAKNTTGKKKIVVASILAGLATQSCSVMAAGAPSSSNNVWGATTPGGVAIGQNSVASGATAVDPATGTVRVAPSIAIGLASSSAGLDTITIGISAGNTKSYGISMGKQTNVGGDYGIAIGYQTSAMSDHAVAIGEQTRAPKMGATVMGVSARGYGQGSVSLGWQALAGADVYGSGINIGTNPYNDTAATINSYQKWGDTAIGLRAVATGGNATALGRSARAAAENSIAIGGGNGDNFNNNTEKTEASAAKATAIGYNAKATAGDTLALGTSSKASGSDALAVGVNANASNSDSIAIGQDTVSNNINSVAFGRSSQATGSSATALGAHTKAIDTGAVAIGLKAEATKEGSISIGQQSAASGLKAITTGYLSAASDENAAAYGNTAKAVGKNSLALGANTQATVEGGVALGAGSIANTVAGAGYNPNTGRSNTYTPTLSNAMTSTWAAVSIGDGTNTRQLTGLAAGTNDTDAVNVAQLKSMNLAFTADGSTKGDVNLTNTNSALNVVGDSTYITTEGKDQTLTISGKKQTITVTDGTASASAGMADANNVAQAINKANAEQTISYKANGGTANAVKVSDGLNFTNGTTTIATIGANGQVTYDLNTTTKQSITDSSTAVNRTISLGGSTGSTTANKLASGDVKFNIKGQTGTNALISTSASGDDVTIAPTSKLTAAVTAAENAANKNLSNISSSGETVIKNLAKGAAQDAVKVAGTGLATVSDNTTGGVKTYTVDVNTGNLVVTANGQVGAAGTTGASGATGSNGVATTQNVATAINDAVTKAKASTTQALADAEHKFDGDTGTTSVRKHGEVLSIKGGVTNTASLTTGNIGVVSDGAGTLNIRLAKVLSGLTSATFTTAGGNTTVINGDGVTITPSGAGASAISMTTDGINAGGTEIKNIADGTAADSAVSKGQMETAIANAQTAATSTEKVVAKTLSGDNNLATVTGQTGTAKGETYEVSVSENAVKNVAKAAAQDAVTVTGTGLATVSDNTAAGVKTYTVNVDEGKLVIDDTTGKVGAAGSTQGTTAGKNGVATTQNVATAINDAVTKANANNAQALADAKHNFAGDDATVISRKHGEQLNIKGGASTTATDLTSGNIAVVGDTTTGTLNIKMAKALTGLTSATFTDGSGNTQIVTGGSSTISDAAGNSTVVSKGGVTTTDAAGNITTTAPTGITVTPAGTGTTPISVTTSGISAGNKEIKNVANGTTDDAAVNKKQMDDAVKAASDATKALGDNTVSLGSESGTTTAKKLSTTGGIKFNIKGETGANALITTSATGDDVTIAPTAKLSAAVTAAEKSADKDLSNLSAAGDTYIKNLAKTAASWNVETNGGGTTAVSGGESVNFINGDNIAITNAGRAITIGTAKNVSFDKVTVGGIVLDKTNGINAGGKEVKGIADGTAADSAVSKGQMETAIANAQTAATSTEKVVAKTLSGDTNLATVTGQTGTAKGETYEVAVSENAVKNVAKAAAQDAVTVTGTGLATVSDNTTGGVKTYTVNVDEGKLVLDDTTGQIGANGATQGTTAGKNGIATTQNVATAINDAVTKAKASTTQALADAEHKFDGDTGATSVRKHGEVLSIKGGVTNAADLTTGNIGVVSDGAGTLNIRLAKVLSGLTSATFKDASGNTTMVTGGSTTIADTAGNTQTLAPTKSEIKDSNGVSTVTTKDGVTAKDASGQTTSLTKGGVDATDGNGNTTSLTNTGVSATDGNGHTTGLTNGGLSTTDGTNTTTVAPTGITATDGTNTVKLNGSGIDAGNTEIKNVGKATTDDAAVNKKQMDDAITKATADATHEFGGDDATVVSRKHGEKLTIKGGASTNATDFTSGNIAVIGDATNGALNIKLAKALTGLTSATFTDTAGNTTTVTGGSTTIADTSGNTQTLAPTKSEIKDSNGVSTVTTKDGVTAKDASGQTTSLTKGGVDATDGNGNTTSLTNTGVSATDGNGHTTGLTNGGLSTTDGTNTTTVAPTGITATDGTNTVKLNGSGIDAGGTEIKNVGKATTDDAAVNKKQMDDAITKATADATHDFAGDDATVISRKHGEQLNIKGGASTTATDLTSGNIAVIGDTTTGTLNIKLAKVLTGLTSATFTDTSGNTTTVTGGSTTIADTSGNTQTLAPTKSEIKDNNGVSTVTTKDGVTAKDASGQTTSLTKGGVNATDGNGHTTGLTNGGLSTTDGTNTTTVAPTGITATDGTNTVKVEGAGIDAGGTEIKNVGKATTDDAAVNKKQMDDAITKATADATHEFGGDDATVVTRKHGEKLTIKGGATTTDADLTSGNIAVIGDATSGALNIKLAKALTGLTSATFTDTAGNTTTVTGASTTIADTSGNTQTLAPTKSEIKDNNGVSTVTTKDGVTSKDASGNTTSLTKGGLSTTDGTNTTTVAPTGITATDGTNTVKVEGAGIDAGGTEIKHIAAGTAADSAVNKGQMDDAITKATADATHEFAGDTGSNSVRKHGEVLSIKGGVTDTNKLSDNNIGVISDGAGTLNVKLSKDLTGLTSATFKDRSGNTQTVTGASSTITDSTGNTTAMTKGGLSTTDGTNTTTIAPTGVTATDGTNIVKLNGSGIDAGNTQIKNVGKATSDDAAVNKKQMDEAVKAASDATKALGNNTITLGGDSVSTTTAKALNTTGGIQFNIKGQTGTDALIKTSASGDDVTITPTAKLTAAVTAAEKSADKDLSNLSAAGNTHIQDLAKSAASWNVQTNGKDTTAVVGGDTVNFINGDNIAITNTGHAITIGTAKNVSFDKVTVGGMTLDKNGILSGISSITGSGNGAPTMTFNSQNGNTPANVSINSNLDMGGHRITGVGPAEKPTDAVNKQQVDQALRGLAGLADNAARQYASKAGANAAALAALKPIQYDPLEPTQIMAGVGNYKSQTAVALGMAHYTNENTMFNIGVSLDSHDNMVNAGVTHKFGYSPEKKAIPDRYKGGPISSIYVMQDEMQALLAKDQEKDAVISKQASEIDTLRQQNEDMQRKIDMILAKLQ